jgi:heat shock protein HslJ
MKKVLLITILASALMAACTGTKNATSMMSPAILNGSWNVDEYPAMQTSIDVLYPATKPNITFDVSNLSINGNTGCNNFNGPFKVNGASIDFSSPLGMTKMMCPGEGESIFVKTLQTANGWTVRDNTLRLMKGDLVVMRLSRSSQ